MVRVSVGVDRQLLSVEDQVEVATDALEAVIDHVERRGPDGRRLVRFGPLDSLSALGDVQDAEAACLEVAHRVLVVERWQRHGALLT